MLPLGRIRADPGAVDLQTLERSRVPDKTLITFFVDLEIGPVIVVIAGPPVRRANNGCELHHDCVKGSGEPLRKRKVTIRLRSVKTRPEIGLTDPDRPSVSDDRLVGPRIDGLLDVLARPIGVWIIPSNDRGQVLFTPSAGGVS